MQCKQRNGDGRENHSLRAAKQRQIEWMREGSGETLLRAKKYVECCQGWRIKTKLGKCKVASVSFVANLENRNLERPKRKWLVFDTKNVRFPLYHRWIVVNYDIHFDKRRQVRSFLWISFNKRSEESIERFLSLLLTTKTACADKQGKHRYDNIEMLAGNNCGKIMHKTRNLLLCLADFWHCQRANLLRLHFKVAYFFFASCNWTNKHYEKRKIILWLQANALPLQKKANLEHLCCELMLHRYATLDVVIIISK